MKKYFIMLLFLSFFLSGCQKKTPIYMDFSQTIFVFSQQIDYILNSIKNLGFVWETENQTNLVIKSENKDFKLDSNINLSGFINYNKNYKDIYNEFLIFFWDKKEQNQIQTSGHLSYKNIENQEFIKLQNFFINLWSGNYQNNLIFLIVKQLENKWLLLDQKIQNKYILYKDINFLLQSMVLSDIFYSTQTVKYNSFLAYKIKIKPNILEYINNNTDIKIKDFDWLLLVKSHWDVALKIENLDIFYNKDFNIKWDIENKNGSLNIKNKEKENTYFNFSWNFYGNQYVFVIKQIINYQEIIKININFINKFSNNIIKNQIDWNIVLSPQIIYWTDLEKEIQIDINGQQEVQIQTWYYFDKPFSYVIFKQILWDEFSLNKIISQENIFTNINNE